MEGKRIAPFVVAMLTVAAAAGAQYN